MQDRAEYNDAISLVAPITITILNKSWQEFIWIFLFFSILSIGILSPISSSTQIPNLADYINHLSGVIQAKMALSQGQFPLRIMPVEMDKLGFPLFQFYSPTSFTFMGLIYWLISPSNPITAINIALWCGLMTASLSMYGLANWLLRSKPAAILAGVVYLYAPYYIVLVNHLASFQEIFALSILPGIFYLTMQRYYYPHALKNLLLLSAGLYVFFTLHIPTALYASVLFAIFLGILTYRNQNRLSNLLSVAVAYAFSALLAMWYLAPAGIFKKYMVMSNTYTSAEHLIQYRPTLSNLLFPAAALTTGYKGNALMGIHQSLGLPILAAVAICVYAVFNRLRTGKHRGDYLMPGLLLIFFIAFLLAWSPINFWQWMPSTLLVAQWCGRLLAQDIWIGALLFAWAMLWLFKDNLGMKQVFLGTVLIICSVNSWFSAAENWEVSLDDFIRQPHMVYNTDGVTINYNKFPTLVSQIESVQVDAGHALQLDNPYLVPASLIKFAPAPTIFISGKVDHDIALTAVVNGQNIETKNLTSGEFSWKLPFTFAKNESVTKLTFIPADKNTDIKSIPVNDFVLQGFLPASEIMNLKQVIPNCDLTKFIRTCEITVSESIKILELPQLYYPQLLKITLNGKVIPYHSILTQGKLITYIEPEAGQLNKITIEFTGLEWANVVSWLAWGSWLIMLIVMLMQRRKSRLDLAQSRAII